MDEYIVIAAGGRDVGIAVRVRGGFMFFSSEPEFRILEATVLSRAEMFAQRAAEIEQQKSEIGRAHV